MSLTNSSPDYEVLSTTSDVNDEALDVHRDTNIPEKKDENFKSDPKPLIAETQPFPVVPHAITMPAEVFEALIQRVAILEKELNELKTEVANRTLVRNVPVVVSAKAISKGLERETTSSSGHLERSSNTAERTRNIHSEDDPQDRGKDRGNYHRYTQPIPFSTSNGRQNFRNSTFADRRDIHYDDSMARDSYRSRFDRNGYNDEGVGSSQKALNRYDDVHDGNNRRKYEMNEIPERNNTRTSTHNNWKSRDDREYCRRNDSEYGKHYENPSTRENYRGASSSRQYGSQDSLDQRSYFDDDRSSNYASHNYNSRNYDGNEMSNSQYERTPPHLCVFCKGRHYPDTCPEVTHHRERRELLLLDGRCEICLGPHSTARCSRKKIPCKHCDDSEDADLHHCSICPFKHY